jgi:DNA-binding CsgD family transcriptional regulator
MTDAGVRVAVRPPSSRKRRLSAARGGQSHAKDQPVNRRNTSRLPTDPSIPQSQPAWAPVLASCLHRQAQSVVDAFGMVGLPIAALGRDGNVLAANEPLMALMPSVVREIGDRLRLNDSLADRLIADALLGPSASQGAAAARGIPVRTADRRPAGIVFVIPIERLHNELAASIYGLLIFLTVRSQPATNSLVLQRLFGLSPAEARVARGIIGGQTLEAIAGDFGVSRETVRSQLKTVLAKTGVKRQLDLAVLMANLQLLKV